MVAIELKIGEFKPEYVGKMNFYLSLLDKLEDHLEVELALQDVNKPIGVAEYQYLLPKNKLQELITHENEKKGMKLSSTRNSRWKDPDFEIRKKRHIFIANILNTLN